VMSSIRRDGYREAYLGQEQNNLLQISECRGVVKLVAYKRAIKVFEYFPTEVKSFTTGYGHEEKAVLFALCRLNRLRPVALV